MEKEIKYESDNNPMDNDYSMNNVPMESEKGFPLLQINQEYYNFDDLVLDNETKERLEIIITENQHAKKLHSYGLKPKNKILFCGDPGTGKTLSAKVISSVMGYPLVYVLFDSIISSYLGETATNLRKIFDFIQKGKYVVLFDEFDIVGKKRDDPHEHGEIKRVVNNFMQMMDNYHGQSILIAATNHQQLLDTAIWRRFDEIIYFDKPDGKRRIQLFKKYLSVLEKERKIDFNELARKTKNYSAADIAQICEESLRKVIIQNEDKISNKHILKAILEQKRKKMTMQNEQ